MSYLESLLATDETLQRVARRHWIVLLRSLILNGIGLVASALLAGIAAGIWGEQGGGLWAVVTVVLVVVGALFVLRVGLDVVRWGATVFAVTTRRVLEVSGVFNKISRDSNLDKINDLVLSQSALGRLLNFGDIDIITGADVGVNRLDKITDPVGFKKVMLDNKEDFDTLARRGAGD